MYRVSNLLLIVKILVVTSTHFYRRYQVSWNIYKFELAHDIDRTKDDKNDKDNSYDEGT